MFISEFLVIYDWVIFSFFSFHAVSSRSFYLIRTCPVVWMTLLIFLVSFFPTRQASCLKVALWLCINGRNMKETRVVMVTSSVSVCQSPGTIGMESGIGVLGQVKYTDGMGREGRDGCYTRAKLFITFSLLSWKKIF
ncbi:hypothetical protein V8F20_006672 [Naviculisporaceae sp. PSN 640]